ncbi:aspartate racemase [Apilactobacillus ozensis DSM 23829 = JCM 17196]|uniref:Aspartate racemase n=1 Tax=Apilactobacillus ozensis DSM 23829 = JCM 17196 TaxID=1423781 RepID=A0A0R2AVM6_9LACO|nr:amino acid racemase [Apilactobacillus ozensis]KRM67913.1 aspartate racemase [Apilactobacillus ozensis DSM 23829 = JCM 17196]
MRNFFSIIGGMGTEATESYIHLLNERTDAHYDQEYLNYILVNHATIPDRTDYILDHSKPNPLNDLVEDIQQQNLLKPDFYTLPCNTAHYFYEQLQSVANAPILHMPKEAVKSIKTSFPNCRNVGLIATQGTIHDHIYDNEIKAMGYNLIRPTEHVQLETMELIYKWVKEKNKVNVDLYHNILDEMTNELDSDVVILGCTELSVAQERAGNHDFNVVDAQSVLVDKTIEMAKNKKEL